MSKNRVFAISMAVLWCMVFGSALHDWSLGFCIGLCMGAVFGLFDGEEKKDGCTDSYAADRPAERGEGEA